MGKHFYLRIGPNFHKLTLSRFNKSGELQLRCADRKCNGKALAESTSGLPRDHPDFFNVEYFRMKPLSVGGGHTCMPIDIRVKLAKLKRKIQSKTGLGLPVCENTRKLHAHLFNYVSTELGPEPFLENVPPLALAPPIPAFSLHNGQSEYRKIFPNF